MTARAISLICAASLMTLFWISTALTADPPGGNTSDVDLTRGRLLYEQQCAGCHGDDGEDTGRTEGIKTLPGIQIRTSDFDIGHRFRGFSATLITEEEREAVVAYVKTFKGRKGYERPELLISTTALQPFVTEPDVRIVDLRPAEAYEKRHLPNAIHLPVTSLRSMPDATTFARLMENIGIGDDIYVVAYDDDGGRSAALLWALLHHYGHTRVSILDGGWGRWVAEGRYVTEWMPVNRTVTFTPEVRSDVISQHPERPASRHILTDEHISGPTDAARITWSRNLQTDGTFHPAPTLRSLYQSEGITLDQSILTVSTDPAAAAQALFTLRLIGYEDVRMFVAPPSG